MALQAPEGTKDLLPDEAKFWAHFKATAADMFGRYGYVTIETPVFEQTELFVRGIGEATDVVSKEMFTAISGENLNKLLGGGTIKGKSRLSLRPEGTAGVVRAEAFSLVQACRDAGLIGEMDHQHRSLKSQFKLADKLGAVVVAVLGPDELAAGQVKVRNMRTHQESAADLAALKKLLAHFGGEPFGGEADSLEAMLGKLEAR